MKVIRSILLLFLCFSVFTALLAQPGGGGGVKILRFYGSNKQYFSPSKALVKKHFILADSSRNAKAIREQTPNYLYSFPRYFAYELKPTFSSPLIASHKYSQHENFQRIMVAHDEDTLVIDFINIPMENPVGMYWTLDSVCLQTAYLRIDFEREEELGLSHMQKDSLKNYLQRGITPSTLPFLERIHFVEKKALTPTLLFQLLTPETTPVFLMEEVKYLIMNDQAEKGLALLNDLEVKKIPISIRGEIPLVKHFAHKKLNQLGEAEYFYPNILNQAPIMTFFST